VFAVATLANLDRKHFETHMLASRYFFSQLWCEFTKEVLTEFLNEDLAVKEFEAEMRN
jgi:hypothetical protein